ncbi:matrix metalloproteinase-23-like [Pseudophryne corroboree]|uniref:matrix metalloproteinase-23-like n=1 Tax=Pseudophryne corroboree TaxID=495146 RepID=UPI0030816EBA
MLEKWRNMMIMNHVMTDHPSTKMEAIKIDCKKDSYASMPYDYFVCTGWLLPSLGNRPKETDVLDQVIAWLARRSRVARNSTRPKNDNPFVITTTFDGAGSTIRNAIHKMWPIVKSDPSLTKKLPKKPLSDGAASGITFPSHSRRWKRYTINPLGYKWDHLNLTYRIVQFPNTLNRGDTERALEIAFNMWSNVSPLTFQRVLAKEKSDLSIGFYSYNHSDCWGSPLHPCFDGLNGELAHAFLPPRGEIHFDNHEYWILGPSRFSWKQGVWYNDLVQVAAHEIGHALGLWHSRDVSALMHPNATHTRTRHLAQDDILAIQHLYGCAASKSNCGSLTVKENCGLQSSCDHKCNGCKEVPERGPTLHKVKVRTRYASKGQYVTFNCTHVAFRPRQRVSWYKDGSRLISSAAIWMESLVVLTGKSSASLVLQAQEMTQGRYTCVIRQGRMTLGGRSWNLRVI